jgi:hypothetical protein
LRLMLLPIGIPPHKRFKTFSVTKLALLDWAQALHGASVLG